MNEYLTKNKLILLFLIMLIPIIFNFTNIKSNDNIKNVEFKMYDLDADDVLYNVLNNSYNQNLNNKFVNLDIDLKLNLSNKKYNFDYPIKYYTIYYINENYKIEDQLKDNSNNINFNKYIENINNFDIIKNLNIIFKNNLKYNDIKNNFNVNNFYIKNIDNKKYFYISGKINLYNINNINDKILKNYLNYKIYKDISIYELLNNNDIQINILIDYETFKISKLNINLKYFAEGSFGNITKDINLKDLNYKLSINNLYLNIGNNF